VLFDRIGRGGMADIFLARADTGLGGSRLCVVKQILPDFSRDHGFEQMLIAEAKLAARLTHANTVQVFDLGREGDRLYIAMEYVEGFDLNQLLRALSQAKVGLSSEFAIFIVREVLRGLDYAHRQRDSAGKPLGIVHRDVSPSNVLVSFEGEVRLCDFGIARALSSQEPSEGTQAARHRVVGKSAYMSPEHARGEAVDARSDVFAAGILLWELCAGRRLYRGSEDEMLAQAKEAKVPSVPSERGLVAQPVMQAVLDRALAADPAQRFQSAQEFLQSLEDYAAAARQLVSQLRFGSFLTDHFGARIIETRRQRELAVRHVPSQLPPPDLTRSSATSLGSERPGERRLASAERRLSGSGASSIPPLDLSHDPAEDTPLSERHEGFPVATPGADVPRQDSTSVTLDALPHLRIWNEPGLDEPPPSLASIERALSGQQPLTDDLIGGPLTAQELELSLSGIAALDDVPAREGTLPAVITPASTLVELPSYPSEPAPSTAMPVPGPSGAPVSDGSEREWIWYLVALLILVLGVVGYIWR
jgi:eukaryotic-like serine/threonine-protein kinase